MRNINLEAAIWNFFTSVEFYEAAAEECERVAEWFGRIAVSRGVQNFGRNNQIYDKFRARSKDLRRGAQLASMGDYKPIWDISTEIRGDYRGILEQSLLSWMTREEFFEFESVKLARLTAYTATTSLALNNSMYGAYSFFNPNPDHPQRQNDDDGFPGRNIEKWYEDYAGHFDQSFFWKLPEPSINYAVDTTVSCETGEEVPWTGVWFPKSGLENRSLTFAIKGLQMQPVYRVVKTREELMAEGLIVAGPKTIAEATVWHPVIEVPRAANVNDELWAKAGQPCPKEGLWQPTDPGVPQRHYKVGEPMLNLGSTYGITVWRWMANR